MVKHRATIYLDVLKDIHHHVLKYFPYLRMRKLTDTSCYLTQWCQNGRNQWINGIHISFDCEINGFLHNHLSNRFCYACIHARESLLEQCSHRGRLQSIRAHSILFWFTVLHYMSKFFTAINFHDEFSLAFTFVILSILARLESLNSKTS